MDHVLPVFMAGTFGWLRLTIMFFAGTVGLALMVLWIWMLVEVLTRETDEANMRLIWALVIIFTHWLGGLLYLFIRRPERIRKLGK